MPITEAIRFEAITRALAVLGMVAALTACSQDRPTEPPPGGIGFDAIVSEPVVGTGGSSPLSVMRDGSASGNDATNLVFVSLPPAAVPEGESATIRNLSTGTVLSVDMQDGGFDPVTIAASVGDEISIEVATPNQLVASKLVVPARRAPKVVRTDPPKGKRDVPLNTPIVVVFSEPVDPATVNGATISLSIAGTVIAGTVRVSTSSPVVAEFTPSTLLAPETTHQFDVTRGVRDVSGQALEEAVSVTFTTALTGPQSKVTEIFVAQVGAGDRTRIARGNWPSWSPDGQRIAFDRDGHVYVMNVDGTGEVRLATGRTPSWSRDGTRIVFASVNGIHVMQADGSAQVTIHGPRRSESLEWDMGFWKPEWSPDGRHIVVEHAGADMAPSLIFIMNADGSNARQLVRDPGFSSSESDPAWSPDGTAVVFWSYTGGILRVTPNGDWVGNDYLGYPTVVYGARPRISPDGRTVMFNTFGKFGRGSVWSVPLGGGTVTVLRSTGYHAVWSPDGTKIAFVDDDVP